MKIIFSIWAKLRRYLYLSAILVFFTNVNVFAFNAKDTLLRATIIDSIKCKANPNYSYALYLPSNYNTNLNFPVIFAFDPVANGSAEANLFKDAF